MTEKEFFARVKKMGGSAYLVGGAVRDALMGRAVSDRDYVVCGVAAKIFCRNSRTRGASDAPSRYSCTRSTGCAAR
ncbi:hypothetical protein [Synergistes jonesii]|uniref:hypothetical protein n=1 Tax=Synergistes jonesii TaxID=2754 RepID=UPI00114CB4FC